MRYTLLLFFTILTAGFLSAAEHDSVNLVKFHNLTFYSPLEEEAFKSLLTDDPEYFKAALATFEGIDQRLFDEYDAAFNKILNEIEADKNFSKKPKKQIQFIFDEIHERYFSLYTENPLFIDIFSNGNFNCLTASVLYAIAFEKYGIPYEIKIIPYHAYVLAYPESESHVVETTNPRKGATLLFDSKDKYNSVQDLIEMKLVTQEEVNEKGIDRVFSDNFLGTETLDLKQAIGALYLNASLKELERYRYPETYELMKKSSYLYPKKTTTASLLVYAATILEQRDYRKIETFRILAEMENYFCLGVPESLINDEFNYFMANEFNNRNSASVDSIYHYLSQNLSKKEIRDDVSFSYYFEKGRNLYLDYHYDSAMACFEKAYQLNPEDKNTHEILTDLAYQKARNSNSIEGAYKSVKDCACKFVKLNQNPGFLSLRVLTLLDQMNDKFITQKSSEAEMYREELEEIMNPQILNNADVLQYMQAVYSRGATYYFRSGRKTQAKNILESGLRYAPDSYELKSKLDALH